MNLIGLFRTQTVLLIIFYNGSFLLLKYFVQYKCIIYFISCRITAGAIVFIEFFYCLNCLVFPFVFVFLYVIVLSISAPAYFIIDLWAVE
jgi:hypothetical protein